VVVNNAAVAVDVVDDVDEFVVNVAVVLGRCVTQILCRSKRQENLFSLKSSDPIKPAKNRQKYFDQNKNCHRLFAQSESFSDLANLLLKHTGLAGKKQEN
jgi:hypothetical protein